MTKAKEIELLQKMIAEAPVDSYLRALLTHVRPQFESDIRSDFLTQPSVEEYQKELDDATAEVRQLTNEASELRGKIGRLQLDLKDLRTVATGCREEITLAMANLNRALN